jgi:hypothetical protein
LAAPNKARPKWLPETDTHDNFLALISKGFNSEGFPLIVDLFEFRTCNRAKGQKTLVTAEAFDALQRTRRKREVPGQHVGAPT